MMAAALRAFAHLATVAIFIQTALGANHVAGGAGGWSPGVDMVTWASAQAFKTGDTITFSYGSLHSVVEVKKANYDACSLSSPVNTFTDGNSIVKLTAPGKRYFICGTPGHCSGGMKVAINTVSAAVAAPLPAPPAASPPVTPPAASPPVNPPAASPPVPLPSNAPAAPPSEAPANTPPAVTPIAAPPTTPSSDFPETAPPPKASSANNLSPLIKIGLATSMLMALVF